MRIDPAALTRGEQLTRYQAWQVAIDSGWITRAEVRDAEGYPPQELPEPAPASAGDGLAEAPAIVSADNA